MNPSFGLFIGNVIATLVGLGVGFSHSALAGILSFYGISLLVDIRYELERMNTK